MKRSYLKSLFLLILLISSFSSYAATYIIGDSLSDAGALGFTFTDPLYFTSPPYDSPPNTSVTSLAGKGAVWTSYFRGISCSWYFTKDRTCTNYAVGGSGVTFSSPYSKVDSSMLGQIQSLPRLSPRDNVIVWIGANDLIKSAQNNGKGISQIIDTFRSNISTLQSKNNPKIFIIKIPKILAESSFVKSNRLTDSLNSVIQSFNDSLMVIPGITIIKFKSPGITDDESCFTDILKSPDIYDLAAVQTSVCQKNTISPNQICGSINNQLTTNAYNYNILLFADSLHPSSFTHNVVAGCFSNQNELSFLK